MAERHSISPRISTTARTLLQQACQERACSQSEVVEAALLAFLTPREDGGTWGQHHRWHLFYAMGALCLLALVAEVVGRRRRAETTTHGSARWATVREVKRAGLTARHGVVVGRLDGRLLLDDGETHVLLTG